MKTEGQPMKHVKVTSKKLPTLAFFGCCSSDNKCFQFWSLFMSELDADTKCTDKGKCTC